MNRTREIKERDPYQLPTPFKIKVDGNYEFIGISKTVVKIRRFFIAIIRAIFAPIFKFYFGFFVEGKENLDKVSGGAVSVCNHVHYLDCVMVDYVLKNDVYILSQKSNFQIPVVRHLIRGLGAIPVPDTVKGYGNLIAQTKTAIENGAYLHIFPEGKLLVNCKQLREFKKGAFTIAASFNCPVIPCIIFSGLMGKKRRTIFKILEPVYADENLPKNKRVADLEKKIIIEMKIALEKAEKRFDS